MSRRTLHLRLIIGSDTLAHIFVGHAAMHSPEGLLSLCNTGYPMITILPVN